MICLEDLQIKNYMIYQDKDSFNFGIDAVLLSNFALNNANEMKNDVVSCDLCSGNLPIPLIMYAKREKYFKGRFSVDAFEIEKDQVAISNKSLKYNKENEPTAKDILDDIKVYNDDIKNILLDDSKYKKLYSHYDMITCNPPYMKKGAAIINKNDKKIIARHEILITFDEICRVASKIIKSNKKFFIINHSERFTEMSKTLTKNGFEIKKAEFIYPKIGKPSNLVLIEAVKGGKQGIKILPPIIVYNDDMTYTKDVLKIYGK